MIGVMSVRLVIVVAIVGLVVATGGAEPGLGQSAPEFADWTAVEGNTVRGTLLGRSVSMSGGTISPLPGSVVDGSSTLFSGPEFTPPLASSDAPELRASDPPSTFTLALGGPVVDPILHLASLGSTLTFPAGTRLVRRSGDAGFAVSGNVVTDTVAEDVEGTVQLAGTMDSISFSARYTRAQLDGVTFQVGGTAPAAPPVETASPAPTPVPTTPVVPVPGVRVVAQATAGDVRVQTAPGQPFVPLQDAAAIPVGAVVDARKGRLELSSAVAGSVQSASVAAGMFTIRQRRASAPVLALVTPKGRARACAPGRPRPRGAVRRLVVSVPKGVLRTAGMKGVARGRNAAWTIADRCDGTLTSVRKGRVAVTAGRRTVRVRPGRSYLVHARLFAARGKR
jgi:hypothetical protein